MALRAGAAVWSQLMARPTRDHYRSLQTMTRVKSAVYIQLAPGCACGRQAVAPRTVPMRPHTAGRPRVPYQLFPDTHDIYASDRCYIHMHTHGRVLATGSPLRGCEPTGHALVATETLHGS